MQTFELAGAYAYRSFLNNPASVDDFNQLVFADAELTLFVAPDGTATGLLSWPTLPENTRAFMDISGRMTRHDPPLIELRGVGRPNTSTQDFVYGYELTLARTWEKTTRPRIALVGSVIRLEDHGQAKAGVTASVVAVKQDFIEPRNLPESALIESTAAMLSSKWHRLWHATWHTTRALWRRFKLAETAPKIEAKGWGVARPPLQISPTATWIDLENGAGEDFLFMHRLMIGHVRADYAAHNAPPLESWKTIPSPTTPQRVYAPRVTPEGGIEFALDPKACGNAVPNTDEWAKTPDFYRLTMRNWEQYFTNPRTLSALSLGALGNLLEFTIHNAMHNRWATPARDPDTGEIILNPSSGQPDARPDFDFSDKWSSPKYDYLGEFYSSHVNPVFWRLHGWVDDRIEDWFRAHEAVAPGRVKRRKLHGVDWFEVNAPFVQVEQPFIGVSPHGGDQQAEIETMLAVMKLIEDDINASTPTVADQAFAESVAPPLVRPSQSFVTRVPMP